MIDWNAIEDRTRNVIRHPHHHDPKFAIELIAVRYALNPWLEQPEAAEVWIEKEALMGVIAPICDRLRVPYFASRGYNSQSEMYDAAQRIVGYDKPVTILYLGDHDPSGIDVTRDTADRLSLLSRNADVTVKRLALNRDQIEEYKPPPNPAKTTDSRFKEYAKKHGDQSWELDALSPRVIDGLITSEVDGSLMSLPGNTSSIMKSKTGINCGQSLSARQINDGDLTRQQRRILRGVAITGKIHAARGDGEVKMKKAPEPIAMTAVDVGQLLQCSRRQVQLMARNAAKSHTVHWQTAPVSSRCDT